MLGISPRHHLPPQTTGGVVLQWGHVTNSEARFTGNSQIEMVSSWLR